MRRLTVWSLCLALPLHLVLGCGDDPPPAPIDSSSAGKAGSHAGTPTSFGATGGEVGLGGAGDSAGEAGSAAAGPGEGGSPSGGGTGNALEGGASSGGAAAGGAGNELPPFVCDREDIAIPLDTWWASYCLAKASTRNCSADFDECYAFDEGLLQSGSCTDDPDSNKLDDVGCAAAALAYTCAPPVAEDMQCGGDPPASELLDEECRSLDTELATSLAACAPQ